jgi:hypothetical protein
MFAAPEPCIFRTATAFTSPLAGLQAPVRLWIAAHEVSEAPHMGPFFASSTQDIHHLRVMERGEAAAIVSQTTRATHRTRRAGRRLTPQHDEAFHGDLAAEAGCGLCQPPE